MKTVFLLALTLLIVETALGECGDHLIPVNSILASADYDVRYQMQLRALLLKHSENRPIVRAVTLSTYIPERAITLIQNQQTQDYSLEYRILTAPLFINMENKKVKERIRCSISNAPLNAIVGDKLKALFGNLFLQTRPPKNGVNRAHDSIIQLVSGVAPKYGVLSGEILYNNDPVRNPTCMSLLSELLFEMEKYVKQYEFESTEERNIRLVGISAFILKVQEINNKTEGNK